MQQQRALLYCTTAEYEATDWQKTGKNNSCEAVPVTGATWELWISNILDQNLSVMWFYIAYERQTLLRNGTYYPTALSKIIWIIWHLLSATSNSHCISAIQILLQTKPSHFTGLLQLRGQELPDCFRGEGRLNGLIFLKAATIEYHKYLPPMFNPSSSRSCPLS